MKTLCGVIAAVGVLAAVSVSAQARLQSSDLLKLRSVNAVHLSPDGTRAAYVVENNDGGGRPYGQLWIDDGCRRQVHADRCGARTVG